MADYVTIANLAASFLGEDDQMRSPDEDSHLGRSVAAVWDLTRRAAIRGYKWNFATRTDALPAQDLPSVPYPWKNSFRLSADSLRVVEVLNIPTRHHYELQGKAILANIDGPLYVRNLVDIPEPALWDDLFDEVMARRLAYQIADRITGDANRKEAALKAYKAALSDATRVDAQEGPRIEEEASGWETARFGYGYGGRDFRAPGFGRGE